MTITNFPMTIGTARLLLAALVLLATSPIRPSAQGSTATLQPPAIAEHFARAFEAREFEKVRSFFAPEARVSRVVANESKPAKYQSSTAEAWIETTRREHAKLSDIDLQIYDTKTLMLEFAATVSLLFSFRCRAGGQTFVSYGIDTYQMVKVGGEWRIQHYAYIDRISAAKPGHE